MNIVVLAAGDTTAAAGGPSYPSWLSEVDGCLLLDRQIQRLSDLDDPRFIFAFQNADISRHHVDSIATQLVPGSRIIEVNRDTGGAACTALLAMGMVDAEGELIVSSATDHIDVDFVEVIEYFRAHEARAGVITFDSLHPRYSFLRIDEGGNVVEAAEKRPISRHANAGFYWYARASDFFDSIKTMILKGASVNGVFYISPSLNEMILQGHRVVAWTLRPHQYQPLKEEAPSSRSTSTGVGVLHAT